MDCDAGQSLAQALNMASEGETILVTGACNEVITITADRITLDGQGNAIIDGGGLSPNPPPIAKKLGGTRTRAN